MRRFCVQIVDAVKKVGRRRQWEYDVFLNFCGEDTGKGFTDFLSVRLDDNQIRTLIRSNDERIEIGIAINNELRSGIEGSSISIAVLSENYASSEWCLRELAVMVQCRKQGQKIIPVFIGVNPLDAGLQTGRFEEAFSLHEERLGEESVKEWREALREVAGLEALDLEKDTKGHQGELAKKLVDRVIEELQGLERKSYWLG